MTQLVSTPIVNLVAVQYYTKSKTMPSVWKPTLTLPCHKPVAFQRFRIAAHLLKTYDEIPQNFMLGFAAAY